jgi:uracil-DNA glycosylase
LPPEPERDCALCPRLKAFIDDNRAKEPAWHNAPVPVFADSSPNVQLLIVGLAPGLRGANRTGRPFTGDYAGDLLFATLTKHGLADGAYQARPDDGLVLRKTAIINAVRCVPPQNKPTPQEINTCRRFLQPAFATFPNLRLVLTLGAIAHHSTVRALGGRVAAHAFRHDGTFSLGGLTVISSYHCSRYNTNTGVLTPAMFDAVFARIAAMLE